MDVSSHAFKLVRGDSGPSPEIRGLATPSMAAQLGSWLVASSFRCDETPSATKVASSELGQQVAKRVGRIGRTESLEARGFQAALKEAERAAKERPLAIQVEECQAFIKRSQNRLEERAKEQQELDVAMGRMAKFREQPATSSATQPVNIPDLVWEIERLRDGGRTRGGTQETFAIFVCPFPRPHRRAGSDFARVGRSAPSARWTAQRGDHGKSDQSRKHSRPEFQSFQSSGLTDAPTATGTGCTPREVARYGLRGRRVGEASHPGPQTSMFRRLRPRRRTRKHRSPQSR